MGRNLWFVPVLLLSPPHLFWHPLLVYVLSGDNALFFFCLPHSMPHSDTDKIPSITSMQHIASISLSFYESEELAPVSGLKKPWPTHSLPSTSFHRTPTAMSSGLHTETNPPSRSFSKLGKGRLLLGISAKMNMVKAIWSAFHHLGW